MRAPAVVVLGLLAACGAVADVPPPTAAASAGTLLLVGGGLDDDCRAVYERLLARTASGAAPRVVIATAATGDQDQEAIDKGEALRAWLPSVHVDVVRRETPTAATVAAIDAATAMFFTGGDQARITARYRPDDGATPEWAAMQRLLARGGVLGGGSAGCAMLGDVMFLGGSSAAALGYAEPRAPHVGPGMHFVSTVMTDSHFFERDRLGRLVAALAGAQQRLGIGVGEDAAVEIDVATGTLRGVTASESLLVDTAHLHRDQRAWRNVIARLVGSDDRVALRALLQAPPPPPPPRPTDAASVRDVPIVEPGQNRQLASWRLFRMARVADGAVWRLRLDGWQIVAWADGRGGVVCDLEPRE